MRYVIIGAGAVGGTVGGRLHQAGADVVFVARGGAHGDAIRAHGLELIDADGHAVVRPVCFAEVSKVDWTPDDVIIIATKSQDADLVVRAVATTAAPDQVFCLTNGLDVERMALRRFGHVHGICVVVPAAMVAPGRVAGYASPRRGVLDVGLAVGGYADVDGLVAADFERAGFASSPVADVMAVKRRKLITNLANVLSAASSDGTAVAAIHAAAADEADRCYAAARLSVQSEQEHLARRRAVGFRIKPLAAAPWPGTSTAQSLQRGATTEVDYLNGEIVLLGRLHDVPTPVNEMIQALSRVLAADPTRLGRFDRAQLTAWFARRI